MSDENKIVNLSQLKTVCERIKTKINSSTLGDTTFSDYTIGSTYTGVEGLCKFSLIGKNAKIAPDATSNEYVNAYYYMATGMTGKKPELPHSHTKIYSNEQLVFDCGDMFGISGTYKVGGVTYTVPDVYDEYNNDCFIQRISDEFYPKSDYITEDLIQINIKGTNSCLFELRIPEKAFGDQIPYKNSPTEYKPLVCPMSRTISEDHLLNSVSEYNNYYGQFMSFAWHEANPDGETDIEKSGYYSLRLGSRTDGSTKKDLIKKLFNSKWYIKYSLAEPIYKYNTGKIYIHTNDVITLQDENDTFLAGINYFKTPDNICSQVVGIDSLTTDILDLNNRVENVEIGDTTFGFPDGVTDNYDYIISLLDNNKNTGINKAINIPAGKYYISKPIILSTSHTSINGNGEVIIKCPNNQPAFIIASNFISINGITFWISKTEDNSSNEEDNGTHCGIYVDSGKGVYNTKITNCDFQGAYRLSTKSIEKSYGIYYANANNGSVYTPNEYGFTYFNIIDNCRFFSVYCGLYIGSGVQPAKVWFSFDAGENIYDIIDVKTNPRYNVCGCGYGCICNGPTNFIRFDGQFIGDDHTTPSNPVFETINDIKTCTSATINNVSVCAVKCSSSNNYIEGFAYDVQRSDYGYIWFTSTASNNMYSILYYGTKYGYSDSMSYLDEYDVYDSNNDKYTYSVFRNHRYMLDENGLNRSTFTPGKLQNDLFLSSSNISAVSLSNGQVSYNIYPKHFGMQDNAIAYLTKWGGYGLEPAIRCYTLNDSNEKINETIYIGDPTNNIIGDVSQIFIPYSSNGFSDGITFNTIPSKTKPIYIDIIFGVAMRFERFVLKFNQFIAKEFNLLPITNNNLNGITTSTQIYIKDNNRGQVDVQPYHEKSKWAMWNQITGIRIIIYEGLSIGDYNPNGYVGISNIFGLASNHGGKSYLPRGGGDLYGDLKLNNNNLYLGFVNELPEASEALRGATIILKGNESDILYTCLKQNNEFKWIALNQ